VLVQHLQLARCSGGARLPAAFVCAKLGAALLGLAFSADMRMPCFTTAEVRYLAAAGLGNLCKGMNVTMLNICEVVPGLWSITDTARGLTPSPVLKRHGVESGRIGRRLLF
jgi:hypothetical protein